VVVLVACLLLAALTKRFVEDPVRSGRWWRVRQWRVYAFATSGIAALALVSTAFTSQAARDQHIVSASARAQTQALLITHKRSCFGAAAMMPVNHCRRPFARPSRLDTAFAAADGPTDPCLQKYDAATPLFCTLGRKLRPTKTIAIIGNSHAWRLVPALELYGQRHGWKIVVATRVNCLGLVSTPIVTSGGASPNCVSWSRLVLAHLLAMHHLDAVVFPAYRYGDSYLEGLNAPPAEVQAARRAVLATWSSFAARGVRVIVPGDVPGMRPANDPDCIAQSRAHDDPCAVARSAVVRPSLTATLAAAHPDVATELPLTSYFCDAKKCHGLIGGVVVYFDSHHITTTYSRSLARYLGGSIASVLRG
jgi:hypothetical protein